MKPAGFCTADLVPLLDPPSPAMEALRTPQNRKPGCSGPGLLSFDGELHAVPLLLKLPGFTTQERKNLFILKVIEEGIFGGLKLHMRDQVNVPATKREHLHL